MLTIEPVLRASNCQRVRLPDRAPLPPTGQHIVQLLRFDLPLQGPVQEEHRVSELLDPAGALQIGELGRVELAQLITLVPTAKLGGEDDPQVVPPATTSPASSSTTVFRPIAVVHLVDVIHDDTRVMPLRRLLHQRG